MLTYGKNTSAGITRINVETPSCCLPNPATTASLKRCPDTNRTQPSHLLFPKSCFPIWTLETPNFFPL